MIEMKITEATPEEIFASIRGLATLLTANAPQKPTPTGTGSIASPAAAPAAPTTPSPAVAPSPVQAPVAPAPSFTVDQVGKAGADLIAANPAKMPELLALLQQYGVPAITELKPEQLGPFATALRGLGAKI